MYYFKSNSKVYFCTRRPSHREKIASAFPFDLFVFRFHFSISIVQTVVQPLGLVLLSFSRVLDRSILLGAPIGRAAIAWPRLNAATRSTATKTNLMLARFG